MKAAVVPAVNSKITMGFDAAPLSILVVDLISKRIRVIGSQQNHREFLFEALDLAARGKVKVVTETYPLAEIDKAYDRVEQGKASSSRESSRSRVRALLEIVLPQARVQLGS
jgi:D-arabinose 1-dehydrogenase-like Zn-dependent alcohol dehydrogenase